MYGSITGVRFCFVVTFLAIGRRHASDSFPEVVQLVVVSVVLVTASEALRRNPLSLKYFHLPPTMDIALGENCFQGRWLVPDFGSTVHCL